MFARNPNPIAVPVQSTRRRFARAALALAVSRLRRRHRRGGLGSAWLVLNPAAMFLIYWCVFGLGFKVTWRAPDGEAIGYIAPFVIGYSLYLFLSEVVGGSTSALASTVGLWRRGGVSRNTVVAALALEQLIKLALYLALAAAIVALTSPPASLAGLLGFTAYLALFVVQAFAVGVCLMYLTPFLADLTEVAGLGLRVFIYAAGLTFPLSIYPPGVQSLLMEAPLVGPMNAARDALLFSSVQGVSRSAIWVGSTVAMAAIALLVHRRLAIKAADIL